MDGRGPSTSRPPEPASTTVYTDDESWYRPRTEPASDVVARVETWTE